MVVVGLCVGAITALAYLPLLATLSQTVRQSGPLFSNSGYLAPDALNLLASSAPTYLPPMAAWYSEHDLVPSVYFAWFVLPVVPWISWRRAAATRRSMTAPLVVTAIMLFFTLGPSEIWLFRWPVRFVEYLYLAIAVLLARALSLGPAQERRGLRALISGAAVGAVLASSWVVTPQNAATHAAVTVGILVLGTIAIVAWYRGALKAMALTLVIGSVAYVPVQAGLYSWNRQVLGVTADHGATSSLSDATAATSSYQGTVLQLGALHHLDLDGDALERGELMFGHSPTALGLDFVGRYTGIGFPDFMKLLCMDYRGSTHCDLQPALTAPLEDSPYEASLIDVLGVDTLVFSTASYPPDQVVIPPGFHVALRDDNRTVLVRDTPSPELVATPSPGTTVSVDGSGDLDFTLEVDSLDGGTVLFNRLGWVGYHARTTQGESIPVRENKDGLLELVVPAGQSSIEVSYTVPGLRTGVMLALGALTVAAAHAALVELNRRRKLVSPAVASANVAQSLRVSTDLAT